MTFELNGKKFADNSKETLNFYSNCPTNYLGPTKVLKCEPEWSLSCGEEFNLSLEILWSECVGELNVRMVSK